METQALINSILYQAMLTKSISSVIRQLRSMCSAEQFALVEKLVAEELAERANDKKG